MDPRPYNYQFRRPRLDNRTYQSYNAYESLYHMGKVNPALYNNNFMQDDYLSRLNRYSSVPSPNPPSSQQHPRYQRPTELYQKQYQNAAVNTDRIDRTSSNRSVKSRSSSVSVQSSNQNNLPVRPSVLSTYGSSSIDKPPVNAQLPELKNRSHRVNIVYSHVNDTSQIFQKQQKPFDIINLYSKHAEPLRKYPKLTKQHLILERGIDLNNN